MDRSRQFASDNYAGICPEALTAMEAANTDHCRAYGEDCYTQAASDALRELFETDCEVYFTFNGTAANSLAIASLCQSFHAVICARLAHIETDECGAPEFFTGGTKVLQGDDVDGKITPGAVEHLVRRRTDLHYPKPKVLSLTQATELGTVYRVDEVCRLGSLAHDLGLTVHMDGARFANAVASLGCSPKDITWRAGVDVLCFGGTKNGLAVGEAVVFFNHQAARDFEWRCKQAGQLASKMRFLAAPWLGLLEHDTWLRHARHANAMARLLAHQATALPGVAALYPGDANAVFLDLGAVLAAGLRARGWHFYDFIGAGGARFMCAWDTREEDVQALVTDMRDLSAG